MEKTFDSYINYVCPHCFNTLDKCTCGYFPPYSLIFIDRNIQEHIRILNEKGYYTSGCCESHYKGDCISIYIAFIMEYKIDFSTLPEGFKYQKSKRTIIYNYKSKITEDKMNAIKEIKLSELLEWCKNLPKTERV